MTGVGRFGALLLIIGGVSLLTVESLRHPPGLWYAAASFVAGIIMVAYTVFLSSASQSSQPTIEPPSRSVSPESKTASTASQTNSHPTKVAQTAASTESADQEAEPATDDNHNPSDPPIPGEELETPSTLLQQPHSLTANTKTTQRTTSSTGISRIRKITNTPICQNRHVTPCVPPKGKPSTGTDKPYFRPVDSSREIKFAQVDTRFSYLDVDLGPEFIDLDLIPDLIEVDVGPSAVSHELVRSPVEIKISSLIKALLMPTPRSTGTVASGDSTRPSTATDNHTRRRTNAARTGWNPATRDDWGPRYREQGGGVDGRDSLAAASRRQLSTGTQSKSFGRETEDRCGTLPDTSGYSSWDDIGASDVGRSGDWRSRKWESVVEEGPTGAEDASVVDEPAGHVGIDYSAPLRDPQQWDIDPFGLRDFDPGYSEPTEPLVEPVEPPDLGFGLPDWDLEVSIEESRIDRVNGEEMFGLDGFSEPSEEAVGLPGLDVESQSNPLLSDGESFFSEEEVEDEWLPF